MSANNGNGSNDKPLAKRIVKALFLGNLIGLVLFITFALSGSILAAGLPLTPIQWGEVGWLGGISAMMGLELTDDLK